MLSPPGLHLFKAKKHKFHEIARHIWCTMSCNTVGLLAASVLIELIVGFLKPVKKWTQPKKKAVKRHFMAWILLYFVQWLNYNGCVELEPHLTLALKARAVTRYQWNLLSFVSLDKRAIRNLLEWGSEENFRKIQDDGKRTLKCDIPKPGRCTIHTEEMRIIRLAKMLTHLCSYV